MADAVTDDLQPREVDQTPVAEQEEVYSATYTLFGVPVMVHIMRSGLKLLEPDAMAAVIAALKQAREQDQEIELVAFGRWLASLPLTPSQGD